MSERFKPGSVTSMVVKPGYVETEMLRHMNLPSLLLSSSGG
jgi:hypothetical protein